MSGMARKDIIDDLQEQQEEMARRREREASLHDALAKTLDGDGAPPVTEYSDTPYLILAAADALMQAGYLDVATLACAAAAIDGGLVDGVASSVLDSAIEAVGGMSAAELALVMAARVDQFHQKLLNSDRWYTLLRLRDLLADEAAAASMKEGGDE